MAAHGGTTVKKARVSATNYKQCLALEVTGYVAFYRSQSDFSGNDVFAKGLNEIGVTKPFAL